MIRKRVFTDIPANEPETRRYRIIQDSLELLRKQLSVDYAGIGLLRGTEMIMTHESGDSPKCLNLDILNKEIWEVFHETKNKIFIHPYSFCDTLSGIDVAFIFRNTQGEPFWYLLLNENQEIKKADIEDIHQVGEIFYDQLYLIIGEEDAIFVKRELTEITESLKKTKESLESYRYDHLTWLFQRRSAMEIFEKSFDHICRSKNGSIASIVLMDIDHFKNINDTYGHLFGDKVLWEIGKLFKNGGADGKWISYFPRKTDTFCRWWGEEIIWFLEETDVAGALIFCEKIRKIIESLKFTTDEGVSFSVSVTIGIKEIKTEDLAARNKDLNSFITKADEALYKGKIGWRNRVVVSEDETL